LIFHAATAMFRWASPQPLSTALAQLLERAGVSPCGPEEAPDLTVFLPPHLLLADGAATADQLAQAYAGLDERAHRAPLINGERLLAMQPSEIAHWLLGHSPRRPLELGAVDPLLAAVTLAQLEQRPELAPHYQRLDARSERGGAEPELDYRLRLQPSAADLLAAWNGLARDSQDRGAVELRQAQQQVRALAQALERQLAETLRLQELAERQQSTARHLLARSLRLGQLMRRLMGVQARLLGSSRTQVRP